MNSTERRLPRRSLVSEYIATHSNNNSDKSYSVETFVYRNDAQNKHIDNQEDEGTYLGQLVNSHTSYKLLNDSLKSLISSNNNNDNNNNNNNNNISSSSYNSNHWAYNAFTDKTNKRMDSFEIEEVVY